MSGTYTAVMGDRGRLVVPAELRARLQLEPGRTLLLIETEDGVVLTTRERALDRVRRSLDGLDPVPELLAERRADAAADDRDDADDADL